MFAVTLQENCIQRPFVKDLYAIVRLTDRFRNINEIEQFNG